MPHARRITRSCRGLEVPDQDFVHRWLLSESPVTLVWTTANEALMAWLEPLWAATLKRLEEGERFIELRA